MTPSLRHAAGSTESSIIFWIACACHRPRPVGGRLRVRAFQACVLTLAIAMAIAGCEQFASFDDLGLLGKVQAYLSAAS